MATDKGYNSAQIIEMERILATELEWDLTPPTVESWIKICWLKWDEYWNQSWFDSFSGSMLFYEVFSVVKENFISSSGRLVWNIEDLYTLSNLDAYKRYIEFTQIVDSIMLDVESIQFKPQAIILASIFWVIAMDWGLVTPKDLVKLRIKRPLLK